jgi:hypothetical protein
MTLDGMAGQRPRLRSGCMENLCIDGNPAPPRALGFLEDHMSRRQTRTPMPGKASAARKTERRTDRARIDRARPEQDAQNKQRNDASSGQASGKRRSLRNPLSPTGDTHIKE